MIHQSLMRFCKTGMNNGRIHGMVIHGSWMNKSWMAINNEGSIWGAFFGRFVNAHRFLPKKIMVVKQANISKNVNVKLLSTLPLQNYPLRSFFKSLSSVSYCLTD